ncbi:siderophore-interacting protein [Actinoplanes sp. NPDC024001]|uniref:siderophore-interacting protein n=1 Tax=Actinoplanes sp. NPDC024001 TaxID=3154598 RepID=UPI0033FADF55
MRARPDDVVGRLADACRGRDIDGIRAVLNADAVAVCDGWTPIFGAAHTARLISLLLGVEIGTELTVESVNGAPGLALWCAGRALAVAAVQLRGSRVAVVWIVVDPAKLGGWHRR